MHELTETMEEGETISEEKGEEEAISGRSPASQDEEEEGRSLASANDLKGRARHRHRRRRRHRCSRSRSHSQAQKTSADSASHGRKRFVTSLPPASLSWILDALVSLEDADLRITSHTELDAHPSPIICIPELFKARTAAMTLVDHINDAMLYAQCRQGNLEKKKLCVVMTELSQQQHAALSEQAMEELKKQDMSFQEEKEALISLHMMEREALIGQHTQEKMDLHRELQEEREKSICMACHDKMRDTIILPCFHFQYCFSCLLRHREANNTCPTCGAPIRGLNMSTYLATE